MPTSATESASPAAGVLSPFRKECLENLAPELQLQPRRQLQQNDGQSAHLTSFLRAVGCSSADDLGAKVALLEKDDAVALLLRAGGEVLSQINVEHFVDVLTEVSPKRYPNRLRFDMTPTQIDALADELLARTAKALDAVAAVQPGRHTFENTLQVLADELAATGPLQSSADFCQNVSGDPAVRDASRRADALLSRFDADAGTSARRDVAAAVLAFAETAEARALTGERRRLLDRHLRNFRRRGLGLGPRARERLREIQAEMSGLVVDFQRNLAEDDTVLLFTEEELAGLSRERLDGLAWDEASRKFVVTLRVPDYFECQKMCESEETRQRLERAYGRRCVESNGRIMERLVGLRYEQARLLGFADHAAYTLDVRMAKTPARVRRFLEELSVELDEANRDELAALLALKADEKERQGLPFDGQLHAWDMRYYCRLREEAELEAEDETVKEYFPIQRVTAGLLEIYQELLGLRFERLTAEEAHVWHDDVAMYTVQDAKTEQFIGHFYLDITPRTGKFERPACFGLQVGTGHMYWADSDAAVPATAGADGGVKNHAAEAAAAAAGANPRPRQYPAAALVANFGEAVPGRPLLLEHDEVVRFFHEFAHVMHQMCSTATYATFAGTAVEQDFVECPSHMLENWCWERESLRRLSGHYLDPSKTLPDEAIHRLIASRNASAALLTKRQLVFGLFDQEIHSRDRADTAEVYARVQREVAGVEATPGTNFAASFSHLAAGGYDAQYYCYLWSEAISCDMFHSRFKAAGIFNPELGMEFRRTVLAPGGSRDAKDLLQDFLGREPSVEPFLRSKGLAGRGAAARRRQQRQWQLPWYVAAGAAAVVAVTVAAHVARGVASRR